MKLKNYSFLIVFALVFVLFSCAEPEKEEMDIAQVRQAIEEANLKFGEAMRQGDAAALAALYTEDTVLLPPNSEMIRGKQGVEEFWQAAIQMGVQDAILTTVDVMGAGELAYGIGKYTLTIQPEGQEPVEDMGKYVEVWKLQADGSWKLHVDIWNSSMPPPPQP
ncbi:MAG: SgcJ/EcaC family oxidoreductase [Acidobacteriota bacterium]